MHYSRLALVAPVLFVSVSAWGNWIIQNNCAFTVYFWEDKGPPVAPKPSTLDAGKTFTKAMFQKDGGGGPSYKLEVADANGNPPTTFVGTPQTQFEVAVDDESNVSGQAWFDISNINANGQPPFKDYGLHVFAVQEPSKAKTCDPGEVVCKHDGQQQGYQVWNDDQVSMISTKMSNDIQLTLCSAKGGSGGGSTGNSGNAGQASPAASPPASSAPPSIPSPSPVPSPVKVENHQAVQSPVSSTPPQGKEAQQQAGATVIITQTFTAPTVVETVHVLQARDGTEKREEHIHAHANAHKKISKRRHGN